MERSEKTIGDRYNRRQFYSLRTADSRCVEVDTNGHLIVTTKVIYTEFPHIVIDLYFSLN
jgi:hypothetical protein